MRSHVLSLAILLATTACAGVPGEPLVSTAPSAAMVAPTPVSALLHAVAVVKAGVFTVLKVIIYIFGADYLTETGASVWLMYVAGATVLLASLVALTKDNLKARLAYSTISQLAYVVLAGALVGTVTTGAVGGVVCHSRVMCRSRGARPPLMRQVVDFCCCCLCCAGLHLSAGASGGGGSRVAFGALLVTSVLEIVGVVGLASVFGDTFTLWNEVVLVLGAAASAAAALLLVASLFAKSPAASDERSGMLAASRRVDELEAKLSQMVDQQAQLLELLQKEQSAPSAAES